jgi:hypothetical protein
MQNITYELKYCERCGSLGLRRSQSADNYCAPCGQILTTYSSPQNALRGPLFRKPRTTPRLPLQLHSAAEAVLSFGRLQ